MNGTEIKEKIEHNNKIIIESNPTVFVLNKKIEEALKENLYLRSICPHKYEYNEKEGTSRCIYCGAAEEL